MGGSLAAGSHVTLHAGGIAAEGNGNIDLTGASIVTQGGQVKLAANRDLTIRNDITRHSTLDESYVKSGNLLKKTTTEQADSTMLAQVEGSNVSGRSVLLQSGADTTVEGSRVNAIEGLQIQAGRDASISSAQQDSSASHSYKSTTSPTAFGAVMGVSVGSVLGVQAAAPFFTKKSGMRHDEHLDSQAVGSIISGGDISIHGGRDVTLQGSAIVADRDVGITALRNIDLVAAPNTRSDRTDASSKTSGAIGSPLQPAIGTVKQKQQSWSQSTSQTGSQVASLGADGKGNIKFEAGSQYTQTASSVLAQEGDIDIAASNVVINEAYNTASASQNQNYDKTAFGGSVSVPLINAARSMVSMAQAGKDSGDSRMQALAAINAGMSAKAAVESLQDMGAGNFGGIKVGVSIGSSSSQSSSTQTSKSVAGSSLAAAGDVNIRATGGGPESNIRVTAAEISAGNNVDLKADNQVLLQAAQSTLTSESSSSSSSAAVGIGFAIGGSQNGFTLDIGASRASGQADGTDTTNTNTHIVAGNAARIRSGGDTTLKGATVSGKEVAADVSGNLAIESLQGQQRLPQQGNQRRGCRERVHPAVLLRRLHRFRQHRQRQGQRRPRKRGRTIRHPGRRRRVRRQGAGQHRPERRRDRQQPGRH